jgi:SPP1 family predicted phage head-tail adaptor
MRKAGRRNHRLWIELEMTGKDSAGGMAHDYVPHLEVWADIRPVRGQERAIAGSADASYDVEIEIDWSPYLDTLTAKWRMRHEWRGQSIIYDIQGVPPIPDRNGNLILTARTGLTEG